MRLRCDRARDPLGEFKMIVISYARTYKIITNKFKPSVAPLLMLILIPGCGVAVVGEKNEISPYAPAIVICNSDTDTYCLEGAKDSGARLNRQALEYVAKKDYDQAMDLFKRAIELDNSNPEYHYNLGLTYYFKGMFQEEESSYMNVLAIEPDDLKINPVLANTYFSLACLYAQQGKKDQAFNQLEKLLTIAPTTLYDNINDRDLDSLRDDPRYKQLLAKKPASSSESGEATTSGISGKPE